MLETYLELLDVGYYEAKFAFDGLADEHVWKRPAEGLLSVGEIAGHIAFWEANKLAGEGNAQFRPDPSKCKISSLLIDSRFAYYTSNLPVGPTEQQLALTAQQVCAELIRVHEESVAYFKSLNADIDTAGPGWPAKDTYREFLKYDIFHVSYHTGQMYSARHLLGEETPDN